MMAIFAIVLGSFTTPMRIGTDPASMLWLLPLVVTIAVVYKATKVHRIRLWPFTRESARAVRVDRRVHRGGRGDSLRRHVGRDGAVAGSCWTDQRFSRERDGKTGIWNDGMMRIGIAPDHPLFRYSIVPTFQAS